MPLSDNGGVGYLYFCIHSKSTSNVIAGRLK